MRMRQEFDAARKFRAIKDFRYFGHHITAGDAFDKQVCASRKLRQLYEARYLEMTDDPAELPPELAALPRPSSMPNFPMMDVMALREWLEANGRKPSPQITHPRLVARAIRRWHDLNPREDL